MTKRRKTPAQKKAQDAAAERRSITSFYAAADKDKRNDHMAMVVLTQKVKEVIKKYRFYFDELRLNDYATNLAILAKFNDDVDYDTDEEDVQKGAEQALRNADAVMLAYLQNFVDFDENWLVPFMNAFESELEIRAGIDDVGINAHRCDDVDNGWLPALRSLLNKRNIAVPNILYTLPRTYAFLTYGEKYYSGAFREQYRTANAFGKVDVWTEDELDVNLWQKFLSSEEPYTSLQVYKMPNYIKFRVPYSLGGGGGRELREDYRKKLAAMATWLQEWQDEIYDLEQQEKKRKNPEVEEAVMYKPPRKKKYTESTYKLTAETFYMKCPGCDYIVVFPKPLDNFVNRSIKRKDGSNTSVWLPGRSGAHMLDLNNVTFHSDFKKKHAYKVMQSHVARCDACHFQPDCFGKPRLQQQAEVMV
jgi:hypothetical protein